MHSIGICWSSEDVFLSSWIGGGTSGGGDPARRIEAPTFPISSISPCSSYVNPPGDSYSNSSTTEGEKIMAVGGTASEVPGRRNYYPPSSSVLMGNFRKVQMTQGYNYRRNFPFYNHHHHHPRHQFRKSGSSSTVPSTSRQLTECGKGLGGRPALSVPVPNRLLMGQMPGFVRRVYKCSECCRQFQHMKTLTAHQQSHRGRTSCPVCQKEFSNIGNRNAHIKAHHQGDSFLEGNNDAAAVL